MGNGRSGRHGSPLHLIPTDCQRHYPRQGGALIDGFALQALIADKGGDSGTWIESVTAKGHCDGGSAEKVSPYVV